MENIILIGIFVVEIALLIRAYQKFGFAPLPTLVMVYFILAQVSLTLVTNDLAIYEFAMTFSRGGIYRYYLQTILLYFSAFMIVTASFASGMFGSHSQKIGSIHFDIEKISAFIPLANVIVGTFAVLFLTLFAIVADWSVIVSNYTYLMMTGDAVLTVGGFSLMPKVMPMLGILFGVMSAINLAARRHLASLFFFVIWLMISIYYVASHQRVALLPAVAFVVVLSVLSRRPYILLKVVVIFYAMFAQAAALAGRGGATHHGLSSLFEISENFGDTGIVEIVTKLLLNITEGVFVVAEGFARNADYPAIYKILSFSPLPSFIDKFSAINRLYQERLSVYAPFSGITEAYFFGPIFMGILVGVYVGAFWVYRKVLERNNYLGLAVGLLIVLSVTQLFSYPLRNSLKPAWMAIGIGLIGMFYIPKPKPTASIDPAFRASLLSGGRVPQRQAPARLPVRGQMRR